jgi:hypothetical protein
VKDPIKSSEDARKRASRQRQRASSKQMRRRDKPASVNCNPLQTDPELTLTVKA